MRDAIAADKALLLDVAAKLQMLSCSTCGVVFAVPASLHAQRVVEAGFMTCPNGHANTIERDDDADFRAYGLIAVELMQAKHELAVARQRLAELGPPPSIDAKELKRRCALLARRAEPTDYGRKICRFCGKEKGGGTLHLHLRRTHADDVREMPAEEFVQP